MLSIAPSFPTLDFKVANNGSRTVLLSEAELAVQYSRPLRYPLLIFRVRGNRSFIIVNEGAGPALDTQVRFTLSPSGERPVFADEYRHVIDVGDIEADVIVDLEGKLATADYPGDLASRIAEAADRDKVVTAVGEVSWTESIAGSRKTCRFITDVYIGPNLYGFPGPPSFIYDVQLRSDATSYMETVPVSQIITPGSTDRFQVALYCDTSSEHRFTVILKSTETVVLSAEIDLEMFVPRSIAKGLALIRSSLGKPRLPFQTEDPEKGSCLD
jgi:hypothetical protein